MQVVLDSVKWVVENGPKVVMSLDAVLLALVALFMLVPGEQPEKAIKSVADFLAKFSKK